jgi:hypothetical protein
MKPLSSPSTLFPWLLLSTIPCSVSTVDYPRIWIPYTTSKW